MTEPIRGYHVGVSRRESPLESDPRPRGRFPRALNLALAGFFFALAAAGAVLPLLPTTPFLLLTSWFLVRSSPRLHARLRASRVFGGFLRDWEQHRAIRLRAKVVALVLMSVVVVTSAASGRLGPAALAALAVVAAIGFVVVLRLRTLRPEEFAPPARGVPAAHDTPAFREPGPSSP